MEVAAEPEFEAVVGLEVHCRLKTVSKAFCACPARFGDEPNSNVCPSCLGLPGALPVFNERALELGLSLALALGCEVPERSRFARKHYFYADLPKGYQISQFDRPLAWGGQLEVELEDGAVRRFRLTRVHLEEDAGKSLHQSDAEATLIDFNRAGTPLVEIVSEPDFRTAAEARAYLVELRRLVRWLGVSDGNMDEGSLRCDCNVSLRPAGCAELGTRVELKNLNSIRSVGRAIEHEAGRQAGILRAGGAVELGTRQWDDGAGLSRAMRGKESAPDYRYLTDPDLPPLVVSKAMRETGLAALPELPAAKRRRFVEQLALPAGEAAVLTSSRGLAAFFEALVQHTGEARESAHWVVGEFLRELSARDLDLDEKATRPPVSVEQLASLMELVRLGAVSKSAAKSVFAAMAGTGELPALVLERLGLHQLSTEEELLPVVRAVLAENPQAGVDYRAGRRQSLGFLVGRVMEASSGRAAPGLVNALLRRELEAG